MILRLRSCPRCKGDVVVDRDYHGWYEECLHCGYQRDRKDMVEIRPQVKGKKAVEVKGK